MMSRSWVVLTLLFTDPVLFAETGLVLTVADIGRVTEGVLLGRAGGVITKVITVAAPFATAPILHVSTPVPALNELPAPQEAGCPPESAVPTGKFDVSTTLVALEGPALDKLAA